MTTQRREDRFIGETSGPRKQRGGVDWMCGVGKFLWESSMGNGVTPMCLGGSGGVGSFGTVTRTGHRR